MKTEQRVDDVRGVTGREAMTFADSRVGKGRGFCIEGALPTAPFERIQAIAVDTFGRAAIEFDRAGEDSILPWGYLLRLSALLMEVAEVAKATSEVAKATSESERLLVHKLRQAQASSVEINVGAPPKPKGQLVRRRVERGADGKIVALIDEPIG